MTTNDIYTADRAEELVRRHAPVAADVERLARQTPPDVRDPSVPVELITVTKFFPVTDVQALYDAGIRTFGENRDQEAARKAGELREDPSDPPAWHYIGQLQSNKAKSVVKYATSVHSIDRASIVTALGKAYRNAVSRCENEEDTAPASLARGGLECLIQVGLDDERATPGGASAGARGGADSEEIERLADLIAETEGLQLAGLMAVAPLGADPSRAFEKLYELSRSLRRAHPDAWKISAGMSGDMSEAIRWGSTSVRVGSAIMGDRPKHT